MSNSRPFPDKAAKTLQNKIIDGGVADNQHQIILPQNTTDNLSDLGRQPASIAFDTTLNQVVIDDGSGFSPIGGGGGGGADTQLSNLVAPTAIPVDLLPSGSLNLGSTSAPWSGMYFNGIIKDKTGVNAIQIHTGFPGGNLRKLFDHSGQIVMNFDTGRALYDTSGNQSILFNARNLQDNTQQISLDWENRQLQDPGGADLLDWSSGLKLGAAQLTFPATDGTAGQVLTTDGATSLSWTSAGGGGANTTLSNLDAPTAVNTDLLPGTDAAFAIGLPGFSWGVGVIQHLLSPDGTLSVETDNRKLIDDSGNASVNWQARTLNDNTGETTVIDWATPGSLLLGAVPLKWPSADGTNGQTIVTDGAGTLSFASIPEILAFSSTASAGGSDQETVVVTGLLATDTILSVSQQTMGAGTRANQSLIQWSGQADNSLTLDWVGDPGAGAIVIVAVKR